MASQASGRQSRVRLLRNPQRAGLIRTKNRGALQAKGEVIVFLDAHCEVNTNWLPPLLTPIHRYHREIFLFSIMILVLVFGQNQYLHRNRIQLECWNCELLGKFCVVYLNDFLLTFENKARKYSLNMTLNVL